MVKKNHRKKHESNLLILCGACLLIKYATMHHIYPQRHFGDNPPYLFLCWDCHQKLDSLFPQTEMLAEEDYLQITREFLQTGVE